MNHFLGFLGISVLVIVTPGQDTALTIRNTLLAGRRAGASTAFGVATGQAVWTVAAGTGIAALLQASQSAFVAVKLAGAVYLVFLGIQALHHSLRSGPVRTEARRDPAHGRVDAASAFRQGLVSNLGNAKMAVFFTSLLPQFTHVSQASLAAPFLLGFLFCLMTLTWLTCYAAAIAQADDLFRRPKIRRVLEGITGAALVLFGVRLAIEHE